MSDNQNTSHAPELPGETIDRSRLNEIGDLVFQVLDFCTDEANWPNYELVAKEQGVPVGQVIAAAVAGTFLRHYTVFPKAPATESTNILEARNP